MSEDTLIDIDIEAQTLVNNLDQGPRRKFQMDDNKKIDSFNKKIIEHDMKLQDKKYDDIWKTCCGHRTDRRILTFFASLIITIILMIFSCYQLVALHDCSNQNLYVGMISLLVGFWVKSPV